MEKSDIESGVVIGGKELYPKMTESPELRWAFTRKVYAILTLQLIVTVGVSSVVFFVGEISVFITTTTSGLVIFFVSLLLPLLSCVFFQHLAKTYFVILDFSLLAVATDCVRQEASRKPHNLNALHSLHLFRRGTLLLFFKRFTRHVIIIVYHFALDVLWKIVLEAAVLTATMVVGLTIYTFWAVRRGHDFSFLAPFLFGSLLIILVFATIQVFHPLGKLSSMIFSCVVSVCFCGYIIYDTNQLIKKLNYDEYIHAAISLYLDVINLFLNLVGILVHT
ncbi:hypothetical protein Bca4012_088771 [Brassica carinata]